MLQKIWALMKGNDTCVLATVAGRTPHCSLMSYVSDQEGREIYMVSHKKTKKFKNLKRNPAVSLLIDTREKNSGKKRQKAKALTINGVFRSIRGAKKKDFIRAKLLLRHPHLQKFVRDPDAEVFSVKVKSFQLLEGITHSYFEKVD